VSPRTSVLALPDMVDAARVQPALVGSQRFVAAHVAGAAAALPLPGLHPRAAAGEARRLADRVVQEAARARGGALSLVVAELFAPPLARAEGAAEGAGGAGGDDGEGAGEDEGAGADGDAASDEGREARGLDLAAADQVLGGLCARLPPGTVVLIATQALALRFGSGRARAGAEGRLSARELRRAAEAELGCLFLHVVNAP